MNLKDVNKETILLNKIKDVFETQSHQSDVFDLKNLDVTLPLLVDYYLSSLVLNETLSKDKLIELHTEYIPGQIKKMSGLINTFDETLKQRTLMHLENGYLNHGDYKNQIKKFFNGNNRYHSDLISNLKDGANICLH